MASALGTLRLALAALALAAAAPAPAQQRLVPEEPREGILASYDADVARVFAEAFRPEVRLRAIVFHSFRQEFAVALRQASAAGGRSFRCSRRGRSGPMR